MRSIEIEGVRFRYRGQDSWALEGVDFGAEAGERVAVIGLTAAGKSTLLRTLNGLVPKSCRGEFSGRVQLFGEDISSRRPAELAEVVGMVFQDFESQLFSTTAELEVAFGPENLGLPTSEIRRRVEGCLQAVGMKRFAERDPSRLSGGQKQRLAIATVLALAPQILVLDEPTTDLDPLGRQEIVSLLTRLGQEGRTIILAEHEPDLLRGVDRIVGLRRGEKVCDLPTAQLLREPELLSSLGVRPSDLYCLSPYLGLQLPREVKKAAEVIRAAGWSFFPDTARALAQRDAEAREREGAEIIRLEGVSHVYGGGVRALQEVNLSFRRGEMVAVLGHNGSGKTTLVKHLNGLLRPSEGAVFLEGKDTAGMGVAELGRRIGFVFQDPDHQIFAPRVWEEVAFGPRNFGFSEAEVKERVSRALAQGGLSGYEERDPFLLTKGERQRVALASVLAAEPEVLILDEPTTGLDYPAQRAVMELLSELNRRGRTIILVTHTLWVAAEYARRWVVMHEGRIVADGPTRRLLSEAEVLTSAGLKMPEITALGLALGAPTLSLEEFVSALEPEKRI